MKKKLACISRYFFFVMLILGMLEEAGNDVISGHHSALLQKQETYLLCVGMLLFYVIPFGMFIYDVSKKWQVTLKLAFCSFISGWFIPGWICGNINDECDVLIKHLSPFLKSTIDAIEPSLVEETLKVLVVFWLLFLAGYFLKKHVFIVGMAVGLGFQLGEDLNYITDFITQNYTTALKSTIINRLFPCLISHTLYTCVMAMGVYYIVKEHHYKRGLFCLFTALFAHALFDSIFYGALFIALSGALLIYVFYDLYQDSQKVSLQV